MITPPEARRVLMATISLTGRGGTDIYTRDLALALLRRGWLPIIYTTIAGAFAEELARRRCQSSPQRSLYRRKTRCAQ